MATEGDPGRARPRSTRPDGPARRRTTPSGGGGGAQARRFALALVVALVIGLVIGLLARGGGSTKTTTAVSTVTVARQPTTTTSTVRPSGAAARPTITLAVLNGSGVNGIAHTTATTAENLGYTNVGTGDAPHQAGPSVVYFRTGSAADASQVGKDLKIVSIKPLPDTGPIADAAPASDQVIAVLGAG